MLGQSTSLHDRIAKSAVPTPPCRSLRALSVAVFLLVLSVITVPAADQSGERGVEIEGQIDYTLLLQPPQLFPLPRAGTVAFSVQKLDEGWNMRMVVSGSNTYYWHSFELLFRPNSNSYTVLRLEPRGSSAPVSASVNHRYSPDVHLLANTPAFLLYFAFLRDATVPLEFGRSWYDHRLREAFAPFRCQGRVLTRFEGHLSNVAFEEIRNRKGTGPQVLECASYHVGAFTNYMGLLLPASIEFNVDLPIPQVNGDKVLYENHWSVLRQPPEDLPDARLKPGATYQVTVTRVGRAGTPFSFPPDLDPRENYNMFDARFDKGSVEAAYGLVYRTNRWLSHGEALELHNRKVKPPTTGEPHGRLPRWAVMTALVGVNILIVGSLVRIFFARAGRPRKRELTMGPEKP
jgi:hypothetical protein